MKKRLVLFVGVTFTMSMFATSALAAGGDATCGYDMHRADQLREKGADRLKKANEIFDKIDTNFEKEETKPGSGFVGSMENKDKIAPEALKFAGDCLVVIPSEKSWDIAVPIVTGINYGRGVEYCKDKSGKYDKSKPTFVQLEGASLGWAFGFQETDLVLAVKKDDPKSRKALLDGDASASFWKYGRSASIGGDLGAKSAVAASYSGSKGFFAGLTLDGANLNEDKTMDAAMDHKPLPKENWLMRMIHASKRKKEDAACSKQSYADVKPQEVNSEVSVSSIAPGDANTALNPEAVSAYPMTDAGKALSAPELNTTVQTGTPTAATALTITTTTASTPL